MDRNKLKEAWLKEEKHVFLGWDFSYLHERMIEEEIPWDYDTIVRKYLKTDARLLDMGTGGGEYLLTLNHPYTLTHVTEGYLPNLQLCQERLGRLGIDVKSVESDDILCFPDNMFDIVINRHESFSLTEVQRILRPGGYFITQQVGGMNNKKLANRILGDFQEITSSQFNLDNTKAQVIDMGFEVIAENECYYRTFFKDIGALVYYTKIIEWEFPGFSVETSFDKLLELHQEVQEKGYVEGLEHRFIMVLRKK